MEMLQSIRYIGNLFLWALGATGIGFTLLVNPKMVTEPGTLTLLMVCALCMVYGINNSILKEDV